MSRGDGRVRLAVRLYVHSLCETVGRSIRLESRIGFARLRDRCDDGGTVLPVDRSPDRSVRPSSHYSSLHDGIRMRHCLTGTAGLRAMAVLSDLFCDRRGGQRCGALSLCAVDFDVVSAAIGYGSGFRNGGGRFGRDGPAGRCAIYCHSI